jgi:hypothetical protein
VLPEMDDPREQFQPTARELLERHIAETNQPKQATPEVGRESEPDRPKEHHGQRYASGLGDYVSQTRAALHNDQMINREYREHERAAQKDVEQHIEKGAPAQADRRSAREALEQHFRDAAKEVTDHKNRESAREQEYER